MSEVDKLAQVIANSFEIQNKKIAELISVVKTQHKPQISVQAPRVPDVNVPEIKIPQPVIDLGPLKEAVKEISIRNEVKQTADFRKVEDLLEQLLQKETGTVVELDKVVDAIEKIQFPDIPDFEKLLEEIKNVKIKTSTVRGGGAIGPSKIHIMDSSGKGINPSIAVAEGGKIADHTYYMTATGGKSDQDTFKLFQVDAKDRLKVTTNEEFLFSEILKELKLIKIHLQFVTDVELEEHHLEE